MLFLHQDFIFITFGQYVCSTTEEVTDALPFPDVLSLNIAVRVCPVMVQAAAGVGLQSSDYKGVTWSASKGQWLVTVEHGQRSIEFGSFANELEAARAFDAAALAIGQTGLLNFPGQVSPSISLCVCVCVCVCSGRHLCVNGMARGPGGGWGVLIVVKQSGIPTSLFNQSLL